MRVLYEQLPIEIRTAHPSNGRKQLSDIHKALRQGTSQIVVFANGKKEVWRKQGVSGKECWFLSHSTEV